MKKSAVLVLAGMLAAGCSYVIAPERQLDIRLEPPTFKPGVKITVMVKPMKGVTLAWVKGLVDLPGFGKSPTIKLKYNEKLGAWTFRSMIPAFITVPSGEYEVRAWGKNSQGDKYEGRTTVTVE